MKLNQKQFAIFAGLSVILSLGIFALSDTNENVFKITFDDFVDVAPLSLVDNFGEEFPDIWCFSKNQGYVRDNFGKVIYKMDDSSPSQGFSRSLSIVAGDDNKEAGTMRIDLYARCQQGTQDTNGDNKFSQEEIDNASNSVSLDATGHFVITVFSKDDKGSFKQTFNKEFSGSQTLLADGKEKLLGFLTIPISEIEKNLPEGNYESLQKVQVTGIIELSPHSTPQFDWSWCTQCDWVYLITSENHDPLNAQLSYAILKVQGESQSSTTPKEICEGKGDGYSWDGIGGVCVFTEPPEEDDDPNVDDDPEAGILNYLLFAQCLEKLDFECLNDTKFVAIYSLVGIIGLLAVMQTHNSSRVVRLG